MLLFFYYYWNLKRRERTCWVCSIRMEGKGREVRRIHIIYFLSRMGRIEHPHLIRVHHLNHNGVYLRDVKRWLAGLRGKDMPDSFAWSYKRRYRTSYVWQDLLDDDLITPISDNEYVLKGSQISSLPFDPCSPGEDKATIQKQQPAVEVDQDNRHHQASTEEETIQGQTSSEINKESPPFGSQTSTLTDDSKLKLEEENHVETSIQLLPEQRINFMNSSPYSNLLNKKKSKKKKKHDAEKNSGAPGSSFTRSRNQSSRAAHMFRNLISCGAVDTKDSVMAMMNRSDKTCSNKSTNNPDNKSEICEGDKLGGSARIFGTSWNHQQHSAWKGSDGVKDSKKKKKKCRGELAAYKPVAGPNCSQCGKSFEPEKMHAHMMSCRGMRALAKSAAAAAAENTPSSRRSANFSNKELASGYFLTH